ncbi:hypothetical protein J23TS9_53140 [Paenibacillus sp. J23TS9]|uniref:hypothetical protein n=1 Tax=Paenibacillus sp. J23TS9 TaxID=2807193 RepID=UPI001B126F8F|nr:hypothetical protein [Paenibacillus sp. J23TS9]GIP30184.1 hypothetical protein J23TS9_53140 [Paenibacillus sp. J23TS9]
MNRRIILTTAASLVIGVVAGTGIMMNDQAYQSVKQAVGGGTSNAVGQMDISSMDIETALQAVQEQRASLLEQQLNQQISDVQKRNEQIANMNNLLSDINNAKSQEAANGQYVLPDNVTSKLSEQGAGDASKTSYTKDELDKMSQDLKGKIDSLSNSQQMDMLRLQSLSNKRNEAFDTMTNFVKKMQDSRNSIIGNMR